MKHGTAFAYGRGKCRCEICRAARAAYLSDYLARFQADPSDPRHGTSKGYRHLCCRCEPCFEAELKLRPSAASRPRRAKKTKPARKMPTWRPWEDAEWLRARYVDDQLSVQAIAVAAGGSHRTIERWMKHHGIPRRSFSEARLLTVSRQPTPPALICACGRTKSRKARTCIGCREWHAGEESPMWRGDQIGSRQAHLRVEAVRGKAAEHPCHHCGGPGKQWAYDHCDPLQRPSDNGPYSVDPHHYMPLCHLCHKRFDMDIARRRAA